MPLFYEAICAICLSDFILSRYQSVMTPQEIKQLENDLWRSADTLRANSDLKATEYSTPVLGLIFLKFADNKFRKSEPAILREYAKLTGEV